MTQSEEGPGCELHRRGMERARCDRRHHDKRGKHRGKNRMARLPRMIENGRVKFGSLVTHRDQPDDTEAAYDLFANQRDGLLKIALTP
jgi:threonine dehydrogenase-like Zn-dependent dehydrogenase